MNEKNKNLLKVVEVISLIFILIFIVLLIKNQKIKKIHNELTAKPVFDEISSTEEVYTDETESLIKSSEELTVSDFSYASSSSEITEFIEESKEEANLEYTVSSKVSDENNCSSNVKKVEQGETYNSESRHLVSLLQNPELPTGCEATSLTMVKNYWGYNVSKTDIAENYLPKSNDFYTHNLKNYGPDFRTTFPGNPFTNDGYGCFAPAIIKTANNYLSKNGYENEVTVQNITGCMPYVLYCYVDEGLPVIVWATMYMMSLEFGESWYTPNGDLLTWINQEHCLVLNGYDDKKVTLYDPLVGVTAYPRTLFETRFEQLGSQAIVIIKN